METKSIIIATFNADRAANLALIEGNYVGGSLTKAQFVKAVMARMVSDSGVVEFNYAWDKFDTETKALSELIESAVSEVVDQCHPAYAAKVRGDEKREMTQINSYNRDRDFRSR